MGVAPGGEAQVPDGVGVARVEEGAAAMDWLSIFLSQFTYVGILLILLACGFGLPIPEDIILITGGVLAKGSPSAFAATIAVSMVGVLGGDTIVFSLGHHFRDRILRAPPFKWIVTRKRMKQIRGLYARYGYWAIFLTRFLAGARVASFLMAGMSQVPYRVFLLADGAAALISVPLFVWLGYIFAEDLERLLRGMEQAKGWIASGVGVLAILLVLRFVVWPFLRARLVPPRPGDEEG